MSATLQLTRPSRLADAVWSYQIVLDNKPVGTIRNAQTSKITIDAGTHTLQLRSRHIVNRHLGLATATLTFHVNDGATAEFAGHPHGFATALLRWPKCVLGGRNRWIVLEGS